MRHVILTRLGIGIARPSFYAQHIAILQEGLLRCMAAQTAHDFEWVICVDRMMDRAFHDRLITIISPFPHFSVLPFDPIARERMVPHAGDLPKGQAGSDRIMITRIDDDDLVTTDFAEKLQQAAASRADECFSIVFANGLHMLLDRPAYKPRFDKTTSVGLSTVSPASDPLEVYSFNHRLADEAMKDRGFVHYPVRSDQPKWIYAVHPGSDSFKERIDATKNMMPYDAVSNGALDSCAVPGDWQKRVQAILDSMPDTRPELVGDKILKRLIVKRKLLTEIKALKKAQEQDSDKYHAMVSAFYAI